MISPGKCLVLYGQAWFERDAEKQTFFRYGFVWIVGGERHPGGMDFGEFAPDGRMRLITVWNSTDDFPVR
jgi:hypothetical protein